MSKTLSQQAKNKSAQFTLVIGNKNYSSWSLRPWLVLKHLGISFDEILIPLRQPQTKQQILKYSPAGKVPILKHQCSVSNIPLQWGDSLETLHQDLVIWESLAIAEYLADLYPEKQLWPEDREARATARAISSEMHAGFMDLRKNYPMDVRSHKSPRPNEGVTEDINRLILIWQECRKKFGKNGQFLFGKFSIADCMFAPIVFRFNTYGVDLSGEAKKYFTAMLNLPAMKEWRSAAALEPYVIHE